MKKPTSVHILVVDDDADNGKLLETLLSREGYQVRTTTEPTAVTRLISEHDFHLVVLDMMMPELSGPELLELIRQADSDISIVVQTGFPTVETAVASLRAQAVDYVRKPIDPESFLSTVRAALERKGLSADPEAELHRTIGRRIRESRNRHSLTLKQMARRTGLSVSLLSQIERAESSASISSLYKIASALHVPMGDLFDGR